MKEFFVKWLLVSATFLIGMAMFNSPKIIKHEISRSAYASDFSLTINHTGR